MKPYSSPQTLYHESECAEKPIADLEGMDHLTLAHVAEAVQYRSLDRKLWG